MSKPKVLIASDHAGVDTKRDLVRLLNALELEAVDLGPFDTTPVDYPDFAQELARRVVAGEGEWGVLICGSGIGMSIAANKVVGARAALVSDPYSARIAREHNDANILVLGARVIGPELMRENIEALPAPPSRQATTGVTPAGSPSSTLRSRKEERDALPTLRSPRRPRYR